MYLYYCDFGRYCWGIRLLLRFFFILPGSGTAGNGGFFRFVGRGSGGGFFLLGVREAVSLDFLLGGYGEKEVEDERMVMARREIDSLE